MLDGLTAGLPNEHFVIAWNRVDFPTLARPTYGTPCVSESARNEKSSE